MWARFIFAVRGALPSLWRTLASWQLSVVLMVLAALYYLLLAAWSYTSPSHVVQSIAGMIPFWIVYGLLLVNTALCLWRRLPALQRDISSAPLFAKNPPRWESAAIDASDVVSARRLLRRLGYRVVVDDASGLVGVRQRFAGLGTFGFHLSFFLIASGFLLTLSMAQEFKLWAAVGEEFSGEPGQFLAPPQPVPIELGFPALRFKVESIAPEFWRDELLFTKLEAALILDDGARATTRINRPLWLGPATFLRLSGFGYTPRYELLDASGQLLDSAFVKLNLFPPGARDMFRPGELPHRVTIAVWPDFVGDRDPGDPGDRDPGDRDPGDRDPGDRDPGDRDLASAGGGATTRSLNLINPAVDVEIFRGHQLVASGVRSNGQPISFEGAVLRFPEIRYWGEFSLVRDPGAPVLLLGFALALAGLVLRLRGRRAELVWLPASEAQSAQWRGHGAAEPLTTTPVTTERAP